MRFFCFVTLLSLVIPTFVYANPELDGVYSIEASELSGPIAIENIPIEGCNEPIPSQKSYSMLLRRISGTAITRISEEIDGQWIFSEPSINQYTYYPKTTITDSGVVIDYLSDYMSGYSRYREGITFKREIVVDLKNNVAQYFFYKYNYRHSNSRIICGSKREIHNLRILKKTNSDRSFDAICNRAASEDPESSVLNATINRIRAQYDNISCENLGRRFFMTDKISFDCLFDLRAIQPLFWLKSVTSSTAGRHCWVGRSTPHGLNDLSPLTAITGLEYISFDNHGLKDISPLGSLKHLKEINIQNNNIDSIEAFRPLNKLEKVRFGGSTSFYTQAVSDLSPLANKQNLRYLGFSFNQIKNIDVLSSLPNLEVVYLLGNPISDYTPLCQHPNRSHFDMELPFCE